MKKFAKVLSVVLVIALIGCLFSACSKGGGKVSGEEQTWGNISVVVPKGMVLTGGSLIDEEDPDTLWIQDEKSALNYFLISIVDPDNAESSLDTTRELNEGSEDITGYKVGESEWHGVKYDNFGTPAFMLVGNVGDTTFQINSYGFEYDSATATAILTSLKPAA